MAQALTDIAIQNLKPRSSPYEVPDRGARGLRVVVFPTGRKSFVVRYRNAAGRTRKLTLPGVTLAGARKLCADALLEVAQGRDPGEAKQAARVTAVAAAENTIERQAAAFIEKHAAKKRAQSAQQIKHVLNDFALPAWRGRNVRDIKRRDVVDLVEAIAKDRPVMANRAQAWLSTFFGWLVDRNVIDASPVVKLKRQNQEQARDRVLSIDELKALWKACDKVGGMAGGCVQMMILLGQRRGEVAGMRRSEIDGDQWTIPARRMKGKKSHTVPLPRQAVEIIERLPRIGDGDLVFTSSGRVPLQHFDRIKKEIDAEMGKVPAWVLHDIRRSTATHMATLGVPVTSVEKILAHTRGTFAGVVGVYQRHGFVPEMKAALQSWADHIDYVLSGRRAKVLPMRRDSSRTV